MSTSIIVSMRSTYSCIKYLRCSFFSTQIEQPASKVTGKVVNVAIIGAPNSGKSTLINKIMERKICAASNKVHTTTKLARAICYERDTQIIFLDTPGVVSDKEQKKYKLPLSMLGACEKSLRCANVVGVVHDVSNKWMRDSIHQDVINMLNSVEKIPSFLILNKVDQLKSKKQLLATIRNVTNGVIAGRPMPKSDRSQAFKNKLQRGYSHFSDVFLVSALTGDGVGAIKEYLISNAKVANLPYSPDYWTDQTPEALIEETVRAKFLDFLPQEIPYNLKTCIEYYDELEADEKVVCSVVVECPSERIARLINGAGGGRLQQIKSYTRNDLMDLFKKTVDLDLQLKVKNKTIDDIQNEKKLYRQK
ncbi:PREDICTED: GTPase Era, mitochondrial [Papilio xuthus]|uniref:GTPase Era, mitochondrial n=1 Tax=Papilio xuthus TaxID=66420 RepID=A0AAJ6ZSC1_PAPXU|nr:PREDICTED: GTPase Era, mitochondrial [Papilio xuthus]